MVEQHRLQYKIRLVAMKFYRFPTFVIDFLEILGNFQIPVIALKDN